MPSLRFRIARVIDSPAGHDSLYSQIYKYVMLAAIFLSAFPLMFKGNEPWMIDLDIISCTLFIIDYVLRWGTADLRAKRHRARAFFVYPITPMAVLDLLSILPTFCMLNMSFKLLRVARLMKLLRVIKMVRYFTPLKMMIAVVRKESKALLFVLIFALSYIFVTALIMFNAEDEVNPETGEEVFESFFDAFYWATCTLTTVGYGDICPVSWIGRLVSILSAIVGVGVIALPSGIITAGYMEELREWKEHKERLREMRQQRKNERKNQTATRKPKAADR